MRYKILLTGKGYSTINDFFEFLIPHFQVLTTSMRHDDILEHINIFQPDILVYCLGKEIPEYMNLIASLKPVLSEKSIPLAIIASDINCTIFQEHEGNIADLTLHKPTTAFIIQEKIADFLNQYKQKLELEHLKDELVHLQAEQEQVEQELIQMQQEKAEQEKAEQKRIQTEQKKAKPSRKHILVIDDDPLMLKVIQKYLHPKYDVATAISGKIAFKFLNNKKADLILLDYEMPEEDGAAVLEKIRQNDATKNLPVIFLTGNTDQKKIQKALLFKPQGYLLKPINSEKLLAAIDKILNSKK